MTVKLTTNNFREIVLKEKNKPVLVDFWAEWCGPCRTLGPVMDTLAEDNEVIIGKVNVDEEQEITADCQVRNVPTVLIYHNGKVVEKLVGVHVTSEYQKLLNKYK